MAVKKRKKKNSVLMPVLVTILSLTVVTFFVVVCAYFASTSKNKETESYVGTGVANEIATESISIKINMENCMMEVGTKTQVTATIYPSGSTAGIIWTSSDENVFTVDANGNLEVIGTGIVALTATFGTVSDSIAIECVKGPEEAVMQLPDYSVFNQNTGNNSVNTGNNETTGSTTAASVSDVTTSTTKATGSTTTAATKTPTTTPATNPATKPVITTQATTTRKPSTQPETTSYVIPTTPPYEGDKVLSTQIAQSLPNYGFSKYLDNTYVFEENDTFLGEVIISSNMTHIYIKERSEGYDNAILDVLKVLLPESNDRIWNMYNGASSDQTVTVDGRVVRVVVPAGAGHTQIVIYN